MSLLEGRKVSIIGGGLAGCEAALQLAARGALVQLIEMRPVQPTPVHKSEKLGELVCSNSFKSTKEHSAAGMLKNELSVLGSQLFSCAQACAVPAGGALAVDREAFSSAIEQKIEQHSSIQVIRAEVIKIDATEKLHLRDTHHDYELSCGDALIVATGPLTSDEFALWLQEETGTEHLAFYDAAAPIVLADSLNYEVLFRQSRYEDNRRGDYLNAPFTQPEYVAFIEQLVDAKRVITKDFETRELFQACQPIEEIARKGLDAPRFGPLKPVGLIDPRTNRRPWAVLQLRSEDKYTSSYNLVGFQTNLTFSEQKRIFRMIPGLENAEFARFGVMHRNTFINAPRLLDTNLRLTQTRLSIPLRIAGQLSGTEGYSEAIMSGLYAALSTAAELSDSPFSPLPETCAFGALIAWATSPETLDYQPLHVNFGIMPPLSTKIRNKAQRYEAYAKRGNEALHHYRQTLVSAGLLRSSS